MLDRYTSPQYFGMMSIPADVGSCQLHYVICCVHAQCCMLHDMCHVVASNNLIHCLLHKRAMWVALNLVHCVLNVILVGLHAER